MQCSLFDVILRNKCRSASRSKSVKTLVMSTVSPSNCFSQEAVNRFHYRVCIVIITGIHAAIAFTQWYKMGFRPADRLTLTLTVTLNITYLNFISLIELSICESLYAVMLCQLTRYSLYYRPAYYTSKEVLMNNV